MRRTRSRRFAGLRLSATIASATGLALAWASVSVAGAALARLDDPVPPPTPAPTAPAPATPPTTPPTAPETTPPVAPPKTAPPPSVPASLGGKPHRVHVIEDRFHEFSGTIRAEEDDYVVVESAGKLKPFFRSRVLEVIDLVDPEPGQPGVVTMRDGTTYSGTIIADLFDGVDVEIQGIRQTFPRKDVHRVTLTLTAKQFYEKARKEIPADHYSDRMRLAQYLFNKQMYVESREELLGILEVVEMHEAKELLRAIDAQLALNQPTPPSIGPKSPDGAAPNGEGDEPDDIRDSGPVLLKDTLPTRILTADDVNLIRVYEFDFRKPPKVVVSPDLIRTMLEQYADSKLIPEKSEDRTALFRADPIKIVRLLFDLKARDLYSQIKVVDEPYALNFFRQRVHNAWLIGNCATSRCHGGVDAGRFFLHNRNYKSTEVRYTNLLILERTKLEGLPPLIDWEHPLDSLIVQYGLTRSEARTPHPDVEGWKPVFFPVNKKLLDDFQLWTKAMYQPRPDYPITFEPPRLASPDKSSSEGQHVPR